jgi:hypothetical protein
MHRIYLAAATITAALASSPAVRAQEAGTTPAPVEPAPAPSSEPAPAPPPPAPPPPPRQQWDREEPPPPQRQSTLSTTPRRRVPGAPEPESRPGFAVEVATSGFASGTLQGGLLLGLQFPSATLIGVRFDYADSTRKLGDESVSTSAFALGLAVRFAIAGSREGLDLAFAGEADFVKSQVGGEDPVTKADAEGFRLAFGPQLRYWVHPNLALGYLAQATLTKIKANARSSAINEMEQTDVGIGGAFTLTAAF